MTLGDEAAQRNTRTDQRSVQRPTTPLQPAPVTEEKTSETKTTNN